MDFIKGIFGFGDSQEETTRTDGQTSRTPNDKELYEADADSAEGEARYHQQREAQSEAGRSNRSAQRSVQESHHSFIQRVPMGTAKIQGDIHSEYENNMKLRQKTSKEVTQKFLNFTKEAAEEAKIAKDETAKNTGKADNKESNENDKNTNEKEILANKAADYLFNAIQKSKKINSKEQREREMREKYLNRKKEK